VLGRRGTGVLAAATIATTTVEMWLSDQSLGISYHQRVSPLSDMSQMQGSPSHLLERGDLRGWLLAETSWWRRRVQRKLSWSLFWRPPTTTRVGASEDCKALDLESLSNHRRNIRAIAPFGDCS
jgi:hypothetical protein